MTTLKEQKEAFVTGYEGTSPHEILLICSATVAGLWLFQYIPHDAVWWKSFLIETALFVLPMILCQSNLLYPWGILYLTGELIMAVIMKFGFRRRQKSRETKTKEIDNKDRGERRRKRGSLTVYRASVLCLTFVAILAVDFNVFPRRFVKTETAGYSLMDMGAASFVVAAGLVSPRSRQICGSGNHESLKTVRSAAFRTLPLIALGLVRLLTHKGLEYQEHLPEYGVHWNFFFTLALVSPLAVLLPGPSLVVPVVIMLSYQYALSMLGWQEWVESGPRSCGLGTRMNNICGLFAANREGILGCIGYTSIYLMSEWIASSFLWTSAESNKRHIGFPHGAQQLFLVTACLALVWRGLVMEAVLGIQVSRRTTNMPFCVWTLLVNLFQLAAMEFVLDYNNGVDGQDGEGQVPRVLVAINKHGLLMFVIANLLTGLVNVSINTLEVGDAVALAILLVYMCSVLGSAFILDGFLSRCTGTGGTTQDKIKEKKP